MVLTRCLSCLFPFGISEKIGRFFAILLLKYSISYIRQIFVFDFDQIVKFDKYYRHKWLTIHFRIPSNLICFTDIVCLKYAVDALGDIFVPLSVGPTNQGKKVCVD